MPVMSPIGKWFSSNTFGQLASYSTPANNNVLRFSSPAQNIVKMPAQLSIVWRQKIRVPGREQLHLASTKRCSVMLPFMNR